MNAKTAKLRQRNTAATAQRIANLRTLVETLRKRNLEVADIAKLFDAKMSCARRYARELVDAGVAVDVSIHKHANLGPRVFSLSDDTEALRRYLDGLNNPAAPSVKKSQSGRLIHTIKDDEWEPRRTKRARPVAPDPLALPPQFFGVKGASQ